MYLYVDTMASKGYTDGVVELTTERRLILNEKEFRKMLIDKDISANKLAEDIGLTHQTMSLKIKGLREFKRNEIQAIKDRLDLTMDEVEQIFLS